MTDALFLAPLDNPQLGAQITITGSEAHHAVSVRRIQVGESVFICDGAGHAIHGPVLQADKSGLCVQVEQVLESPSPKLRCIAVQALAKGDRAELAVETMTELGIDQVVPWRASRSIVKWDDGARGAKQLSRWQSTAREAAKQSRRFRIPEVTQPVSTNQLCQLIAQVDSCFILHETASAWLHDTTLPKQGTVMFIIGPEGGISPQELESFQVAGGKPVLVSDAVLRTSTAGVAALAQIKAKSR